MWGAGGSGAPTAAKYIVQEAHADLSAEQSLGALATGIVKNTTTAAVGVLSIATGQADFTGLTTADGPSFDHLHLTIVTGTAPMVVASETEVANLNSHLLSGHHAADFAHSDAKYIVGLATADLSAEKVKAQLYNNYDIDDTPAAPNALDDEFDNSSLDGKWTLVNNPGAPNAISETAYPGYIWIGLTELGTDNYAALIQMGQPAPATGNFAMEFVAKVCVVETGESANIGEFAGPGIMFNNSANSGEMWGPCCQLNDALGATQASYASTLKSSAGTLAGSGTAKNQWVSPSQWVYLKLAKTTTAAYTSANTYISYYSLNGIIWHEIGTDSITFTTACDTVGIYWRRPKSQVGTPLCYALVDFFRRTV
jgi:hypothetical protein